MELKKLNTILKTFETTPAKQITLESNVVKLHIVRSDAPANTISSEPNHFNLIKENDKNESNAYPKNTPTHNDIISNEVGYFSRFHPKEKKQIVKLRDTVAKGELVAIIKSAHIKHELFSQVSGKIIEFLVEEGQPVEYGQPLIRLENK